MLSCREISERASDLIEGRTSWRVRAEARLHLLMCRHCSRYIEQLKLTMRALRGARPSEPMVDVDKVLDAIDRADRKSPL